LTSGWGGLRTEWKTKGYGTTPVDSRHQRALHHRRRQGRLHRTGRVAV